MNYRSGGRGGGGIVSMEELEKYMERVPEDVSISVHNAYKTRWVWYHTILALELVMANVLLACILTKL